MAQICTVFVIVILFQVIIAVSSTPLKGGRRIHKETVRPTTHVQKDLAYTSAGQCSLEVLQPYEHCLEIGCTLGAPCRREELSGFKCCLRIFNGQPYSCCAGSLACPKEGEETKEEAECPPREIPPNGRCLEMGCDIGAECKTPELRAQVCCLHTLGEKEYTCCLQVTEEERPRPCHELTLQPEAYECMPDKCKVGNTCTSSTGEKRSCCKYTVGESDVVTCCLVPRKPRNCARYEPGRAYSCLFPNCVVGYSCDQQGYPYLDCCDYMINNRRKTCCLLEPQHFYIRPPQTIEMASCVDMVTPPRTARTLFPSVATSSMEPSITIHTTSSFPSTTEEEPTSRTTTTSASPSLTSSTTPRTQTSLTPRVSPITQTLFPGTVLTTRRSSIPPPRFTDTTIYRLSTTSELSPTRPQTTTLRPPPSSRATAKPSTSRSFSTLYTMPTTKSPISTTQQTSPSLFTDTSIVTKSTFSETTQLVTSRTPPVNQTTQRIRTFLPTRPTQVTSPPKTGTSTTTSSIPSATHPLTTIRIPTALPGHPSVSPHTSRRPFPSPPPTIPKSPTTYRPPLTPGPPPIQPPSTLRPPLTPGRPPIQPPTTLRPPPIHPFTTTKLPLTSAPTTTLSPQVESSTQTSTPSPITPMLTQPTLTPMPSQLPVTPIEPHVEGCPKQGIIERLDHCMEIGCQVGTLCTTKGNEGITCCEYNLAGKYFQCCKKRRNDYIHSTVIKPPDIGPSECPSEIIPPKHHCLEVDCELGARCKTEALRRHKCCPFKSNNYDINCCLAKPEEKSNYIPGCDNVELLPLQKGYICASMGCVEGDLCIEIGRPDVTCCPYRIHKKRMSCCSVEGRDITVYPPDDETCNKEVIEDGYNCFEVGCVVNERCRMPGLTDHICCKYLLFGATEVTCCLGEVLPKACQIQINTTDLYDCNTIGCIIGDSCPFVDEFFNEICCLYNFGDTRNTCCLKHHKVHEG